MRSAAPDALLCALALAVSACGNSQTPDTPESESLPALQRYVANDDATVTDRHSGLMWATADQGSLMPWGAAQKYAAELETGGYDDWRLPTLEELRELYDPTLPGYIPVCTKTDLRVKVPASIRISCGIAWAQEHDFSNATHFNFFHGQHFSVNQAEDYTEGSVAIPVRGPIDID
jgi:hypothetical protein